MAAAREALNPLRRQVEESGGHLTLEGPDALPPFPLDRDAFTQILINLVDNAVKYGKAGGDIEVALSRTESELVLTVDNQGEQILPKERRRIFEDFRRGRGRERREVSGVGLGLALVRRFARAHGGEARCLDAAGPGARFQVTFRLTADGNEDSTAGPGARVL